jgi:hypothetical protein
MARQVPLEGRWRFAAVTSGQFGLAMGGPFPERMPLSYDRSNLAVPIALAT